MKIGYYKIDELPMEELLEIYKFLKHIFGEDLVFIPDTISLEDIDRDGLIDIRNKIDYILKKIDKEEEIWYNINIRK